LGDFQGHAARATAKDDHTTALLASQFGIRSSQVKAWKKQLMAHMAEMFAAGRQQRPDQTTDEEELYEKIGCLKMGVEWLKTKLPRSTEFKRQRIECRLMNRSIDPQCQLAGLAQSSWCYEQLGASPKSLALRQEIDRLCITLPFFGTRKV
jgi:hypothetical protein